MGMIRRKRLLWLLVLPIALFGLGLGAGLLFADRLLDEVLRPRLERLAAERLQAQVSAARLVWEDGGLTLSDLTVARPERYRLVLPRARVLLSLSDLLRRRLSAVELTAPQVVLHPAPSSSAPAEFSLPTSLPLAVGSVEIRSGALRYADPRRPWAVRDIGFSLRGGADFHFSLQGHLATADTPVPVALAGTGQWQNGLSLTISAVHWQGRALLREPVTLALPAGAGGGRAQLDLAVGQVRSRDLQQWLAAFSIAAPLPQGWDLTLNDLRLAADWQPDLLQVRLSLAHSGLRTSAATLPIASLQLSAVLRDGVWQGEGTFALSEKTRGTLNFQGGAAPLQGRMTLAVDEPNQLQKQVLGREALPVAGAVRLSVEGSLPDGDPELVFHLQGKPGMKEPPEALLDVAPLVLEGTVARRQGAWHGTAELRLEGRPLAALLGRAEGLQIDLRPYPWSRLRRLMPTAVRPAWLEEVRGLSGRLVLRGVRQGWQADATLRAELVAVSEGRLQDLQFRGRLAPGEQGVALSGGRLRGELVHARFGAGVLQAGFDARLHPAGWQLDLLTCELGSLELMSPDGQAGLAGGRLHLQGRIARSGASGPLELRLAGRAEAREALWGPWYGEVGDLPLDMILQGAWQPGAGTLRLSEAQLDVGGLAQLSLTGGGRLGALSLRGKLAVPELDKTWNGRGRVLLRELHPSLADLSLTGGLEADLDLKGGDGGWQLRGEMRLRNLEADSANFKLVARAVQGNLPVAFHWPLGQAPAAAGLRPGRLTFAALACGPVALADRELLVAVGDNRLEVAQPLRLAAGGGQVVVEGVRAGFDPGGLRLETTIRMAGIDLERLTSELGMPPMAGTIDADLGHIRYADGLLNADGEMRIEAFGGELLLRNLQLDPFSLELPQARADIDFTGIDLFRLTRTFSFGAIHGVVDGRVRGLRLYGATPSHFTGHLQTRLEGKRDISVKALNNLSILSQGGLSAALSRGIYRFIDFYRYRRIGMACELQEDTFTLRGTAREGSDRYLVDGGLLPPKINIIAPARQISFREMLRRLQRIDRTGRRSD